MLYFRRFNYQVTKTKILMKNLSIAKNKMINTLKEEEWKCCMIKSKEGLKLKNLTLIGEKSQLKSNIKVQDFKKKNKSLLNGIFLSL